MTRRNFIGGSAALMGAAVAGQAADAWRMTERNSTSERFGRGKEKGYYE